MVQDWGWGIGPRDAMRAGWKDGVGDVQYIKESYTDPSAEMFRWWWAAVGGKIADGLKIAEKAGWTKIAMIFILSKIASKMGQRVSVLRIDDQTMKIFALGLATKMACASTKIIYLMGKILARIGKIEFTMNIRGGNLVSLTYYQGTRWRRSRKGSRTKAPAPMTAAER